MKKASYYSLYAFKLRNKKEVCGKFKLDVMTKRRKEEKKKRKIFCKKIEPPYNTNLKIIMTLGKEF